MFKVKDARNQEAYALKRLIASDKESTKDILNEIQTLTKLQPHPHIMKFISWGQINNDIYLVLCELCGGGSLSDLTFPLSTTQQLNRILYQTANAISHLHRFNIIHRDIKAEVKFQSLFYSGLLIAFLYCRIFCLIIKGLLSYVISVHQLPILIIRIRIGHRCNVV